MRVNAKWLSYATVAPDVAWRPRRNCAAATSGTANKATTTAPPHHRIAALPRFISVCQSVKNDVDADGIAVGRELVEEARVLAFPLPRVRDVGVMRHQHDHVAVMIDDALHRRGRAVRAALRVAAAAGPPELDRRDLRQRLDF